MRQLRVNPVLKIVHGALTLISVPLVRIQNSGLMKKVSVQKQYVSQAPFGTKRKLYVNSAQSLAKNVNRVLIIV